MGLLDRFDIEKIINEYNVKSFVETGTGYGHSIKHALLFRFEKLYSIEIEENIYQRIKSEVSDERLILLNNNSKDGIIEVLKNILYSDSILFWLDAHFPGADFGFKSYGSEKDSEKRIPLESELRTLVSIRDISKDYFIIDDLRIYEDGPFSGGNWDERRTLGGEGIEFIHELFDQTHNLERDYRDQGYIILSPKL